MIAGGSPMKNKISKQDVIDELYRMPVPTLDAETEERLRSHDITPLGINSANRLLEENDLQNEIGTIKMPSKGWLVATKTFMPFVSASMIPWWFWWYPQDPEIFRVWLPGEQFDISVKQRYLYDGPFLNFYPSIQYPYEKLGGKKLHLSMQYIKPAKFGFKRGPFRPSNISDVFCGHMGILHAQIRHTEFVHIFKKQSNGLSVISRFWMGEKVLPAFQRKYFTEENAYDTGRHFTVKFMRLAQILPTLYNDFR